jgi:hypothetical protein
VDIDWFSSLQLADDAVNQTLASSPTPLRNGQKTLTVLGSLMLPLRPGYRIDIDTRKETNSFKQLDGQGLSIHNSLVFISSAIWSPIGPHFL